MKKLILTTTLFVSTLTFAQEGKKSGEKLTQEQQTELQVKNMTLQLDLDEKQQKEIKSILVEQKLRKASKNPFAGGIQPIFPATGSTIIAAIWFLLASKSAFTFSISL